ncbi:NAD-dependent epimerase/dehydratase family protein, partial [PVC group bacterium]|nr:NAD-dependent epimerase/dehydratase family protein [PVC group bacterium]
MKILLAGATGFIGKSLVHSLGEAGHHVTALTRSKTKNNLPCVSIV